MNPDPGGQGDEVDGALGLNVSGRFEIAEFVTGKIIDFRLAGVLGGERLDVLNSDIRAPRSRRLRSVSLTWSAIFRSAVPLVRTRTYITALLVSQLVPVG